MLPVVAIVGRPNVGKSTLFNKLTRKRDALVMDTPGSTRDRIVGEGVIGPCRYILVDTGGISGDEFGIDQKTSDQSRYAIAESDVIMLLVDGRSGLTAADEQMIELIRASKKPAWVVVNKVEGIDNDQAKSEFYKLGFGEPLAISAAHNQGLESLMEIVLQPYLIKTADEALAEEPEINSGIKIAVVGRPNVGKSTLVNRILGEQRVVVYDEPGTTRDSIYIPMERMGHRYTIIDTAGVRRRGRIEETLEKFSVVKTLQAIEVADVVVFLMDAQEGVTEQDLHLLGLVLDAGRALVIAINKWDGLDKYSRERIHTTLDRRLEFAAFARQHFISALHGTGVGSLFESIEEAYHCATKDVSTGELTRLLEEAVTKHQPPLVQGRRIKLRYAHLGGHLPPVIIIHGNQTHAVKDSYTRYLENFFRNSLKLVGTPLRIEFRTGVNPFAGVKNKLTFRQIKKRQRMIQRHKE